MIWKFVAIATLAANICGVFCYTDVPPLNATFGLNICNTVANELSVIAFFWRKCNKTIYLRNNVQEEFKINDAR